MMTQTASKTVFQVAYVNWTGQWTMDAKKFRSESAAQKHEQMIKKTKAENGKTSVRKFYV